MLPEYFKPERESAVVRIPGFVILVLCCVIALSEFFRTLPGLWLGDLGSFIESGWAATVQLNPYGIYPNSLHVRVPGFDAWNPNMNPPISVVLFRLFTFARPPVVFRQWYLISMLIYIGLIWLMVKNFPQVPRRVIVLWMASLATFWETLNLGQIYIALMGVGVIAWLQLDKKRDAAAGICMGILVAIKPQFLLWPLLLILARHFRAALISLATTVILSVIPVLVYGPAIYKQWLNMLAECTAIRVPFITNISLPGLFGRMGMMRFGIMLGIGLCLALCIWAIWKRPPRMSVSSFAVVVALLAAPIAWMAYVIILVPLLLSRWNDERVRLVAFILCVPTLMVLTVFGASVWVQVSVGSVYNWGLILLFSILAIEEYRNLTTDAEAASSADIQPAK